MIINELLVDKYRVQKALDQEVGHSLSKYVSETHIRVRGLSQTYGLQFRYGRPAIASVSDAPNRDRELLK